MDSPHPFRLRAYHNPENVDESRVPKGWRFRYADEIHDYAKSPCRAWAGPTRFCQGVQFAGVATWITYIVPVA